MEKRLKELMERIEEWPEGVQREAIASLEAIARYISLHESSLDGRQSKVLIKVG
jgi:hypothetical protein